MIETMIEVILYLVIAYAVAKLFKKLIIYTNMTKDLDNARVVSGMIGITWGFSVPMIIIVGVCMALTVALIELSKKII